MKVFGLVRVLILAGLIGAANFGAALAAKAPAGSYRDSCAREYASRDVLHARCEQRHRRYVWAKLEHYSSCVGDIGNYFGELICLRRRDVPRGDWSDSCINPHLSAPGVFAAVCKSLRGGWIASEIAFDKCRSGFTNARGHLGCMKAEAREEPPPALAHDQPPPPPAAVSDTAQVPPVAAQNLPAGSYQRSCRNLEFDGRYLSGECQDKRGAWQDTSLDTRGCAHDQEIGNANGELVCTRSTEGRELPAGKYQKTCRNLTFDGRFLRGECQEASGPFVAALLDTRTCKAGDEFLNEDGEILCRQPKPPAPPAAPAAQAPNAPAASAPASPPKPPAQTTPPAAVTPAGTTASKPAEIGGQSSAPVEAVLITLYEKKSFDGASRSFSGDAPDLAPLGWNDLASSLQVRGTWEVCEEPNFGGRCQRINEDQPDLGDLKLSNHISSFRRVTATLH